MRREEGDEGTGRRSCSEGVSGGRGGGRRRKVKGC
jgi:hypothetical protein